MSNGYGLLQDLHALPVEGDVVAVEGVAGEFRVIGIGVDGALCWVQLRPVKPQTGLRVEASRLRKVQRS